MNIRAIVSVTKKNLQSAGGGRPGGYLRGAAVGICLALVPLVVVLIVTNGMIRGITERYIELGSYHLQLRSFSVPSEEDVRDLTKACSVVPEVIRVVPVIQGTGLAYSSSGKTGVSVRALPPEEFASDRDFIGYVTAEAGDLTFSGERSILLSTGAAETLGVAPGDQIVLLTARTERGRSPVLRPSRLIVDGIFSSGYRQLDSMTVYIPLKLGRRLFGGGGSGFVGLRTEDPFDHIDRVAMMVAEQVPNNWYVYTWYQIDRSLYRSLRSTKVLLLFIMGVIVVVAVSNISSATTMLVLENMPEIAIMKSFGASPRSITLIFLGGAVTIGFIGTITGIAIGLLVGVRVNEIIRLLESGILRLNTVLRLMMGPFFPLPATEYRVLNPEYYLEEIPIILPFYELAGVMVIALVCSVLAAFLPAVRAGQVRPLYILRKH
jgi:lipoprotein-releasing system permease protein